MFGYSVDVSSMCKRIVKDKDGGAFHLIKQGKLNVNVIDQLKE